MAVDTRPIAPNPHDRLADEQLIARFRAGEDAALDVALRRHERKLLRFARRILGDRSPNAEDVEEEAFLRTHLVLRRGDRPIDLKPWLFKLVRNCALDELARARAEVRPLDAAGELAALGSDPADVSAARSRTRDTLADVAALPDLQRHALLRRELEGASHADVAAELSISEAASRLLVARARTNLVKARAGRDAACDDVRDDLLRAHDRGRRAAAHAYRHLATCAACREFRTGLRVGRHDMRALAPLPALLGVVVGAKALSGFGGKAVAAGAVTAAAAGGALVFGPGDPAPVAIQSVVVPGGHVEVGDPLPAGTAVVTREVEPQWNARHEVACPAGMRVGGLAPTTSETTHALAPETIVGSSTTATVLTERTGLSRLTLAIVCRTPDADGSILARSRRTHAFAAAAGSEASVCTDRTYLRHGPRGEVVGQLSRRQPVTVQARREGWRRVVADSGASGWVARNTLCAR